MNDALQPGGGAMSDDSPEDDEEDVMVETRDGRDSVGGHEYGSNSSRNDDEPGVSQATMVRSRWSKW